MSTWNEDRVELLRRLWADGYSCSHIAQRLGGVTRNAVIGKVTRLGLPGRTTISRKTANRKAATLRRQQRKSSVLFYPSRPSLPIRQDGMPLPTPAETDIPRVSFNDLNEDGNRHCRWVCVDNPSSVPQDQPMFCGQEPLPGLPYCEPHARRAYTPPQVRRRETAAVPVADKQLQVA